MYICPNFKFITMRKIVLLSVTVLTTISLISCKKGEEKKPETGEVKKEYKENFNIQINATASKKDDFAFYYTEDNTVNFKGENAIWGGIKGGNVDETINFELTEERIPTNIRLDFGLNKEQDSVVVKSIKVNFFENSFVINGSDFFNYFNKDEQFKYKVDPAKGTLTIYKKDNEYKTPYFYPTILNNEKIKELTTKKKE